LTISKRIKQLKIDIPAVFIALKYRKTPLFAKILAALAIIYTFSPIDLIPDFIPIIWFLDDVILWFGLIALIIKIIPADVFAECRNKALVLWADGKLKIWYFALPVIFYIIRLLFGFIIVKNIWL
jgi:uncharacterized membrane protein YkvA (DUF1232 family)